MKFRLKVFSEFQNEWYNLWSLDTPTSKHDVPHGLIVFKSHMDLTIIRSCLNSPGMQVCSEGTWQCTAKPKASLPTARGCRSAIGWDRRTQLRVALQPPAINCILRGKFTSKSVLVRTCESQSPDIRKPKLMPAVPWKSKMSCEPLIPTTWRMVKIASHAIGPLHGIPKPGPWNVSYE